MFFMVEQGGEALSGDSLESPSEGELAILTINSGVVASLHEACTASVIIDSAGGLVRRHLLLLVITIFAWIWGA
jgi:hypothetical protein